MKGIELKNLTKNYGKNCALDNVSVKFDSGKIYGLLGRNGAGKSTMLNLISNRIFPTSGEILIDGEPSIENDRALSKVYCMSEKKSSACKYEIQGSSKNNKAFLPEA